MNALCKTKTDKKGGGEGEVEAGLGRVEMDRKKENHAKRIFTSMVLRKGAMTVVYPQLYCCFYFSMEFTGGWEEGEFTLLPQVLIFFFF